MEAHLNVDNEELKNSFTGFSKLDSEFAANTLRENISKRAKAKNVDEKLQLRLAERVRIHEEQQRRLDLKRAAYEAAHERYRKSELRVDDLRVRLRQNCNLEEAISYSTREAEYRLTSLNELFSNEEVMQQRAMMVHSIKDLLDTSIPITYNVREEQGTVIQELFWVTAPMRLVVRPIDEDGRANGVGVPTRGFFGPFRIEVSRKYSIDSMHSYMEAKCNPVGMNILDSGFWHPHVSREGDICLGTAKRNIMALMKDGDYAGVIHLLMDVLTSYNPRDPYHSLSHWEPERHTHRTCNSCNKPELFCDCSRSSVTGQVVEEKFLSPCGCTYQECLVHHERTAAPGQGINGTTCVPSRHGQRFTEEGQVRLSSAIQKLEESMNS